MNNMPLSTLATSRWRILEIIERRREIATYFAEMKAKIMRTADRIVVVTYEPFNIQFRYPKEIEEALNAINKAEYDATIEMERKLNFFRPQRIGVVCPHCGSTNTYERTKDYGRIVMYGIWCGDCAKESIDGSESSTAIKRIKNDNKDRTKET